MKEINFTPFEMIDIKETYQELELMDAFNEAANAERAAKYAISNCHVTKAAEILESEGYKLYEVKEVAPFAGAFFAKSEDEVVVIAYPYAENKQGILLGVFDAKGNPSYPLVYKTTADIVMKGAEKIRENVKPEFLADFLMTKLTGKTRKSMGHKVPII
jgi:hypothetical protein